MFVVKNQPVPRALVSRGMRQASLLARESLRRSEAQHQDAAAHLQCIDGKYRCDYISATDEQSLLNHIDQNEWLDDLKRRVQHYGYRYDYRARKIKRDMRIGELPEWVLPLAEKLRADFFGVMPQQMIVNEYHPGQGIAPHVDCVPCFGDVVASVSLGSTCVMNFSKQQDDADERIALFLEPRSVVVLGGESRAHWMHGIAPRKNDSVNGRVYARARRVSLTFRTVRGKN